MNRVQDAYEFKLLMYNTDIYPMNLIRGTQNQHLFHSCAWYAKLSTLIYLVIGGVAKNFMPLLLNVLEIENKMEAIRHVSYKLHRVIKDKMWTVLLEVTGEK